MKSSEKVTQDARGLYRLQEKRCSTPAEKDNNSIATIHIF